ncbi:MAG: hypothetical protein J0653_02625 [Deltaproteobacteria bacterium]|jgi:cell division protein FtsB|nr:hypothetical protein [Deltaproteobacteria bacterium]
MNIETIIGFLAPVISALAAYVFARRKNVADAQASELDNVDKAVTIWRKLAEQLEANLKCEMDSLRRANAELREQIDKLSEENSELRKKMKTLDQENRKLIEQLKIFNQRNKEQGDATEF